MRLQYIVDLRFLIPDDGPGQKHATGFAADHAGSDHMIPNGKIILRRKMLLHHLPHLRVTGHHDIAHSAAAIRNIRTALMHDLRVVEEPIPGIDVLLLRRALGMPQGLVEPAGLNAIQNRAKGPALLLIDVRQEHGIRIPIPDLLRTDIDMPLIGIHIDKELSRIQDLIDGLNRMLAPDDGEESNGVQDKKEGAGNTEEIPHHQIRGPRRLEFRQAVEDIEGIQTFPLDHIVDLHGEILKPMGQRDLHPLHLRALLHQRLMAGKPEINYVPPIRLRLLHIRLHEQTELRKLRHSPHHIIPQTDMIQCLIHFGYSAFYSVECCHRPFLTKYNRVGGGD